MAIYTVHQPPLRKRDSGPDPERFLFVRDGFSFWAFLFGPLWMLRHRMWLVLLGYIVVAVAVQAAMQVTGVSAGSAAFAGFMLALLIGMESGTLRRFALGRRGWQTVGTVVGGDREEIERRFFNAWTRGETVSPAPAANAKPSAPSVSPTPHSPTAAPDVVGLFPQPGAHR
jgi:hypothetical protein